MASALSRILKDGVANAPSGIHHVPSFNDFCSGVEDDIEDDMKKLIRSDTAPPSDLSSDNNMYSEAGTKSIGGDYTEMITNMRPNEDVWRHVFQPGSNKSMARASRDFYDHVPDPKRAPSTWDYILKSEELREQLRTSQVDTTRDGYVDHGELQRAVGPQLDAGQLLQEAGQSPESGRIKTEEFMHMLEVSQE